MYIAKPPTGEPNEIVVTLYRERHPLYWPLYFPKEMEHKKGSLFPNMNRSDYLEWLKEPPSNS